MEREATSDHHLLNLLLVRWVQVPSGKCRFIRWGTVFNRAKLN
jgi:hypothetical protein